MTGDWFNLVKIIHIASLIFWLGPSLGAWWVLRATTHRFGEPSLTSQFMYVLFLKITGIEHIALVMLLGSGTALAIMSGSFEQPWFILKLGLILLVILPIELFDIWFCHIRLPHMFQFRHPVRPYAKNERKILDHYHHRLVPVALLIIPVSVAFIFWLAVSKPFVAGF